MSTHRQAAAGPDGALNLPEHMESLAQQLPAAGLALLTDFDGTISPIAPTPSAARVDPACRAALERLAPVLPLVACLSGRPVVEVAALVGVEGIWYSGSHGLEEMHLGQAALAPEALERLPDLQLAMARLKLPHHSAVEVEQKPAGLALHYRKASQPEDVRVALELACAEAVAGLRLRVLTGRKVLEIVPDVAADKGVMVRRLLRRHAPAAAFYLGDDVTDVSAFAALAHWGTDTGRPALGLAVYSTEGPAALFAQADYQAWGVPGVATVLTYLADRYSPGAPGVAPAAGPPAVTL